MLWSFPGDPGDPDLCCLLLFSSVPLEEPTTPCRDARHFSPVPLPLGAAWPLPIQPLRSGAGPLLPVPPGARGLEEAAQSGGPPRPGSGCPFQLAAGPARRPRMPGPPAPGGQLRRPLQPGGRLVRPGLGLPQPARHAAAARRTGGAEGHHHGSPGAQDPEHAAGPQEGVGVSMKGIRRQQAAAQIVCLKMMNLCGGGSKCQTERTLFVRLL